MQQNNKKNKQKSTPYKLKGKQLPVKMVKLFPSKHSLFHRKMQKKENKNTSLKMQQIVFCQHSVLYITVSYFHNQSIFIHNNSGK